MIYGDHRLFVRFKVTITTKRLSVIGLDDFRSERLRLLKSMWDDGMSYQEITEHLRLNGYRTPQGLEYTYTNVVMTLQKYVRRLKRIRSEDVVTFQEALCVQSIRIVPDFND